MFVCSVRDDIALYRHVLPTTNLNFEIPGLRITRGEACLPDMSTIGLSAVVYCSTCCIVTLPCGQGCARRDC